MLKRMELISNEENGRIISLDFHDFCIFVIRCILKLLKLWLGCYGLYPFDYYSIPALSWDTIFEVTGVKLNLISDIDLYQFVGKVMRRRVSNLAQRYSKINSEYRKLYIKHQLS